MKLNYLYITLTKIYEQIDYNEEVKNKSLVTRGSFQWRGDVKDTVVEFKPNNNGRFYVSWIPSSEPTK